MVNILKKFTVTLTKKDSVTGTAQGDAKLSGAVYGIYNGETLTDENGYAQSKDLPYGHYTVHQTKGLPGRELLPDFEVYIAQPQTYRYIANNRIMDSLIEIVKKDIETGKIIPADGIGFKVKNTDTGEWVVQHLNYPTPVDIDTYYTAAGMLMMPSPLSQTITSLN